MIDMQPKQVYDESAREFGAFSFSPSNHPLSQNVPDSLARARRTVAGGVLLGDEMKEILLSKGYVAQVDDWEYERVAQWKWSAKPDNNGHVYAIRQQWFPRKMISLHRFIMNAPDGVMVDHEDGNGLNCQQYNMRLATRSQNLQNATKRSNNTSGYKGVNWRKDNTKWQAQIRKDNKQYHIGYFITAEDAARAYDSKAVELFGEFARLNFPKG